MARYLEQSETKALSRRAGPLGLVAAALGGALLLAHLGILLVVSWQRERVAHESLRAELDRARAKVFLQAHRRSGEGAIVAGEGKVLVSGGLIGDNPTEDFGWPTDRDLRWCPGGDSLGCDGWGRSAARSAEQGRGRARIVRKKNIMDSPTGGFGSL